MKSFNLTNYYRLLAGALQVAENVPEKRTVGRFLDNMYMDKTENSEITNVSNDVPKVSLRIHYDS